MWEMVWGVRGLFSRWEHATGTSRPSSRGSKNTARAISRGTVRPGSRTFHSIRSIWPQVRVWISSRVNPACHARRKMTPVAVLPAEAKMAFMRFSSGRWNAGIGNAPFYVTFGYTITRKLPRCKWKVMGASLLQRRRLLVYNNVLSKILRSGGYPHD